MKNIKIPGTGYQLTKVQFEQTDFKTDVVHRIDANRHHPWERVRGTTTLNVNLTFEAETDSLDSWNLLSHDAKQNVIRRYFEHLKSIGEM